MTAQTTTKQDLATIVRETKNALRTMGSGFTELLSNVLIEAHDGSGFYMAQALIELNAHADKENRTILREAYASGGATIFDLKEVPKEQRTLHLLGCFQRVIDEQRALNDLPPLKDVL
jgi:hypothetical protein